MCEIRGIPFYPRHDVFWAGFCAQFRVDLPPPILGTFTVTKGCMVISASGGEDYMIEQLPPARPARHDAIAKRFTTFHYTTTRRTETLRVRVIIQGIQGDHRSRNLVTIRYRP